MKNKNVTSSELIEMRDALGLSNKSIANLLGMSEKTWLNRICENGTASRTTKIEYEYLLLMTDRHPDYMLVKR